MKCSLSVIVSTAVAMMAMLLIVQSASADDMGTMDMSGMTHEVMPAPGENAASMDRMMSSEGMEHDPMMAAHMAYTQPRRWTEADQQRADQTRAGGVSHPVELFGQGVGVGECRVDQWQEPAYMIPGREFRHDAAVLAVNVDLRGNNVGKNPSPAGDNGRRGFIARRLDA